MKYWSNMCNYRTRYMKLKWLRTNRLATFDDLFRLPHFSATLLYTSIKCYNMKAGHNAI